MNSEQMSDSEEEDILTDLVNPGQTDLFSTESIQLMLQQEKNLNPSKFASHWEMDENDVNEATDEEKQNNPVIRTLWAAETANMEVLHEMLVKDASLVKAVDSDGYTPLHRAAYEGHVAVVEFLLNCGASINAQTADGWTPLHSAVYWGQTNVVSTLIRCGASINVRTNGQQTPLHLAAAAPNGGSRDVVQLLLLNSFIDVRARNQLNETARDIAERSSAHRDLFRIVDDAVNFLLPVDV